MEVEVIDLTSKHLASVKALGAANSTTLGFFPEGAFDDYASRRQIIVALGEERSCVGYLLYRVSNNQAIIVHLCVAESSRRSGVAERLVNHLKQITKCFRGIGLRCRRDYEANKVWPRFNFSALHDRPGRGKDPRVLTFWWFDHGHPDLFTSSILETASSKLCVVVDANVFFDLKYESRPGYQESNSLTADWLAESVEICVTDEILNDINRSENDDDRRRNRESVAAFTRLPCQSEVLGTITEELARVFPQDGTEQDESDLRHLARTIASDAKFFITRDEPLLSIADQVYETFGVTITRPADFVIRLDELQRENEYQPVRLAGTLSEIQLVPSGQESVLTSRFQSPARGESRSLFQRRLRPLLADPKRYNCYMAVDTEKTPLALFVYDQQSPDELMIPLFRVAHSKIAETLSRHLILRFVRHSARTGHPFTRITDPYLDDMVSVALADDGFFPAQGAWVKLNLAVAETSSQLSNRILGLSFAGSEERGYFSGISRGLSGDMAATGIQSMARIEQLLWPGKIVDAYIPTFIVPIRPEWAMHLFDEGLANETLFGAEYDLALSRESAYYRSTLNSGGLKAPGRILWYVSSERRFAGGGRLRACSRLDEVTIDTPKNLYRRFKRLGVYKWEHVYDLAQRNIDNSIMALRFSDTELFAAPVNHRELLAVLRRGGVKTQLQSPVAISPETFAHLYRTGMRISDKEILDA
jgi:predicted nucleic acid-binding protein